MSGAEVPRDPSRSRSPPSPARSHSPQPPKAKRARRERYVSQACLGCKARKVKCSGGLVCSECEKIEKECVYPAPGTGRRRRRATSPGAGASRQRSPSLPPELVSRVTHMTARLSRLEQTYSNNWARTTATASSDEQATRSALGEHLSPLSGTSQVVRGPQQDVPTQDFGLNRMQVNAHGNHNFPTDDGAVRHSPGSAQLPGLLPWTHAISLQSDENSRRSHPPPLPPVPPPGAPPLASHPPEPASSSLRPDRNEHPIGDSRSNSITSITESLERELALNNGASFRLSFDIYFRYLNSLHPIINENQFRQNFDDLAFGESRYLAPSIREQFRTLVYLVRAEVTILCSHCPEDSAQLPGWLEFRVADRMLSESLSDNNLSVLTIQCLLMKARYAMYVGNIHQAYDTITIAVRCSYQMGLHDQSLWHARGYSPFEVVMCQRIFWCLVVLEQVVSQNCGVPYIIRDGTYDVDMPTAFDDRNLFPGRPLPQPTPERSFIPYLQSLIEWSSVCKTIWDMALSVGARKTVDAQTIVNLDRTITLVKDCWGTTDIASPVHRTHVNPEQTESEGWQRAHFHLKKDSHRLLIRYESLMKHDCSPQIISDIIDIARSSIATITDTLKAPSDQPKKYFTSISLARIVTTLSTVITKCRTSSDTQAVQPLWNQSLALLRQIATGFQLANRSLQKCQGSIDAAKTTILTLERGARADEALSSGGLGSNAGGEVDHGQGSDVIGSVARPFERGTVGDGDLDMSHGAPIDSALHHHHLHHHHNLVSHFPTPSPGLGATHLMDDGLADTDWSLMAW